MVKESELKQCSYFLVRYVPDVVKGEFINIGVFLSCPAEHFLDCEFSNDWRRVYRFHADADTELLKDLQSHFQQQIKEIKEQVKDLDGYVREMQQCYSNLIQLSPPQTCLTADLAAQLRDLFNRYVGAHLRALPERGARILIKRRLTESLRKAGLLEIPYFEKNVRASEWTKPDDPFIFDFGYTPTAQPGKPNGRIKLIHSHSMTDDREAVESLVWTFERVLEKGREKESHSHLTVGHEDNPDLSNPQVRFSLSVLQHEHIRLVPVSGFDEYAQSVRAELSI
jgi:hypothetical protein